MALTHETRVRLPVSEFVFLPFSLVLSGFSFCLFVRVFLAHLAKSNNSRYMTEKFLSCELSPIGLHSSLTCLLTEFPVVLSQNLDNLQLWHSSLQRTYQTAQPLKPFAKHLKAMRMLNEIYAGLCEGMSYEEVKAEMPVVSSKFQTFMRILDPLH